MSRHFTEEEGRFIQWAATLTWGLHHAYDVDEDGKRIPVDERDTYILIGEHGWREPFHICPHEHVDRLIVTAIDKAWRYPPPCPN